MQLNNIYNNMNKVTLLINKQVALLYLFINFPEIRTRLLRSIIISKCVNVHSMQYNYKDC